jgi:hypothetical protein
MPDAIKINTAEAQVLSKYLVGQPCSEVMVKHYAGAVSKLYATLTDTEQKTWDRMLRSRLYLKVVDSGLAIVSPQSALRKRIFIMLALLEASPDFTAYFLPQERSIFYLIPLGLRTGMSAIYLAAGVLLVKVLGIR